MMISDVSDADDGVAFLTQIHIYIIVLEEQVGAFCSRDQDTKRVIRLRQSSRLKPALILLFPGCLFV